MYTLAARSLVFFFLSLFANVSGIGPTALAQQPQRFAFVVTVQKYTNSVAPLQYSDRDGEIVSGALKKVGFRVRWLRDASKPDFFSEFDGFIDEVKRAGPNAVALFYFSGHSFADVSNSTNHLIFNDQLPSPPPEGISARNAAPYLSEIGIPLKTITTAIGELNAQASFVVIDSHLDVTEPALLNEALRSRPAGSPHNGMILVAQGRPGMQAADTNDFSRALAGALQTPGLDAVAVFKQVQVKVAEVTNGRQVPWIEDRLLRSFRFSEELQPHQNFLGGANASDTAVSREVGERLDLALWDAVKDSGDSRMLQAYLTKYPQGTFAQIAKLKLEGPQRAKPQAGTRSAPALGRRVALVIGNSEYMNVRPLYNPKNDARDVAEMLKTKLGFTEVKVGYDLGKSALLKTLRAFGESAATADWAVIYYAGHGMEVNGTNYLVPVDAALDNEGDVEDETVPVARLIDRSAGAKVIKIIILDACRENPFLSRMQRTGRSRGGINRGLAEIRADTGTLIAYATAPGDVAADGVGEHSPYTFALLQHLAEPELDIRIMFGKVLDAVMERSGKKQQPWFSSALGGAQFQFKPN